MSKKSKQDPIRYRLTEQQRARVSRHLYEVEALLESIRSAAYLVTDTIPPTKGEVAPVAIDAMAKRAFAFIQKATDVIDEGTVT